MDNKIISQMRDATAEEDMSISKYINSISKPTGFNMLEDKSTIDRIIEFISAINSDINKEMNVLPKSNEDAIRKSSYCYALDKVIISLENIIAGRDYNNYVD